MGQVGGPGGRSKSWSYLGHGRVLGKTKNAFGRYWVVLPESWFSRETVKVGYPIRKWVKIRLFPPRPSAVPAGPTEGGSSSAYIPNMGRIYGTGPIPIQA